MNIQKIVYAQIKNKTKMTFNDDSLISDLGIDSLDLVELITDAEEELKVTLTDDDLENIQTVKQIIEVLEKAKSK